MWIKKQSPSAFTIAEFASPTLTWHLSRKSCLLTLKWSRTSKSRFKSFATGTWWIFAILLTILQSSKLLMRRLRWKSSRNSPWIPFRKMKWSPTTAKNPFLWRQLRYCSVQIFCGNTFSTMIYLLPSWQPRASSALWGPASSFRSQSQGISPRCGCSDIENLSQLYFCHTGSSTTLYFGVACGVVIIIFWGLLINVFWELTWDSTTYID